LSQPYTNPSDGHLRAKAAILQSRSGLPLDSTSTLSANPFGLRSTIRVSTDHFPATRCQPPAPRLSSTRPRSRSSELSSLRTAPASGTKEACLYSSLISLRSPQGSRPSDHRFRLTLTVEAHCSPPVTVQRPDSRSTVRDPIHQGWYLKVASTPAAAGASKAPTYPERGASNPNTRL